MSATISDLTPGPTLQISLQNISKQVGLQRNAAVAMGNSKDRRYVPALLEALHDVDSVDQRAGDQGIINTVNC